eukprot:COSAG02_NODE_44361_length_367_cov_0.578358_1_plen_20_part_10
MGLLMKAGEIAPDGCSWRGC